MSVASLSDISVLLVDDITTSRAIMRRLLEGCGIVEIDEAANGAEALEVLQKRRIDVVISDQYMPVMDGTELIDCARRDPRLSSIPFIVVSAGTEQLHIHKTTTCGDVEILTKPVTQTRLQSKLLALLRRA